MKKSLEEIHERARRNFEASIGVNRETMDQCLSDRRFYSIPGAQWEGEVGELFQNRPKLEINKGHSSVIRIFNEYRANRITVDFVSCDGEDRSELADTCDRLYRADENKSSATEAYDNAFEEGTGGGIGAWRYRAIEEDETDIDNGYLRIAIEPIYDADSTVVWDVSAKRYDKADAKECWVLIPFTRDAYIEEFDDDPSSWPKEVDDSEFDWSTEDRVYVVEYYLVEEVTEVSKIYENNLGERRFFTEEEVGSESEDFIQAVYNGYAYKRDKRCKVKQVRKYLMSGNKILSDEGIIAGRNIPIVPFYGKRWIVDGIERAMGHIRLYKDPQRVKNTQYSRLLEISSFHTIEKPIFTAEQMSGHWDMWSRDSVENYPALLINPITNKDGEEAPAGALGYTKPPTIPQALAALMELTEKDMQDILGNQGQGDKIVSNISGDAVERIQNRLDMQSFIYMSNFAKSMKRGGEIWLSMAREVYLEKGRKMMALGRENEVNFVELKQPVVSQDTGDTIYKNDFSDAKFEIIVDIGPSYASKKAKVVSELKELFQFTQDAESRGILLALIMVNSEGEGLGDIRKYFRKKLLRMGVLEPNEEEQRTLLEELQNKPPDASEQLIKSTAKNEEAKAVKAVAEAKRAEAQTKEYIAKAAEILSGIDREDQRAAMEMASRMQQAMSSGPQFPANETEIEESGPSSPA